MKRAAILLGIVLVFMLTSFNTAHMKTPKKNKMVIEIWSDVVCPFCYIGKRRFEKALVASGHQNEVEIVWKSFQLNPNQTTNPNSSVTEDLAKQKGWTVEYTRQMSEYVSKMAAGEGLTYDFDKAVVANSLSAHRVLQFAKSHGKGDELKEALLAAYFTEGKNIDDDSTLAILAQQIGLSAEDALKVAQDEQAYLPEVQADIDEARQLQIQGVPFFVFDRKYAVSGAQEQDAFTNTLEKALDNWRTEQNTPLETVTGNVCTPEGDCD